MASEDGNKGGYHNYKENILNGKFDERHLVKLIDTTDEVFEGINAFWA